MVEKQAASRIFSPFRALGFCSNQVPICIRHHVKHNETYVVTCVGKSFHTYNTSRLGIVSVSNSHSEDITCLAANARLVFTACTNVIRAFPRGRLVAHEYRGHEKNIHILLPFGQHLISVDEESTLKIWEIATTAEYLELKFDNGSFAITSLVHPATYVNKILLASRQGVLQLWNVKTATILFTFPGWDHAVTTLEQSPAIDVIAIGLSSGDVYLHNIKFDETVVKFHQDWGPITTISFRTDGHPVMTTGSPIGHIALWDLEKRRLQSQIREAHSAAITGMKCLPSQPLMVTSSGDNSIKIWIFDQADGSGRLLNERSGHSAPPTRIQFHGNTGHEILSAGQDSTLRLFSTLHERHNKSFGRASYNKAETKRSGLKKDKYMMPPIINFTSEASRSSDWDCIVACHRGERPVTTWNYDKHTMGKYKLQHARFTEDEVKYRHTCAECCSITSCGNYCVLGYTSGHVDVYNLQSGIHRGSFTDPPGDSAHGVCVRGVVVDGLNQCVATGDANGQLKFWRFKQKTLLSSLNLTSPVADMRLHRESSLLAVVLDDFTVVLVDMDGRNKIRHFDGHINRVTDVAFSTDARWLMTASMDCTVRTWDVPTGRLVDSYRVSSACTSLCMSTNGEYLTSTHVDDLGVYLWTNMALYQHIDLKPLPNDYKPRLMTLPSSKRRMHETESISPADVTSVNDEDEDMIVGYSDDETIAVFKSPEQISDELVTLSLLPSSRWQNLLNLDLIRLRNKPKEPPKAPKSAPFFIPTITGLEPKLAPLPVEETTKKVKSKLVPSNLLSLTQFGMQLSQASGKDDYSAVLARIQEMGPSGTDTEIRSLSPDLGGSVDVMANFIHFIKNVFSTNRDFQLAQSYLGLFLKIHGDVIASEPILAALLADLYSEQTRSWTQLQDSMNSCLCLVNYLKSATV